MRFACPLRDRRGEETQVRDRARDVERARQGDGFSAVARFELRERFEIGFDEVGEARDQPRAFLGGRRRPHRRSVARRADGGFDVARARVRAAREHGARRGFEHVEIAAFARRLQAAVDEVGERRRPVGCGVRTHAATGRSAASSATRSSNTKHAPS
jgi:hypothetical protein